MSLGTSPPPPPPPDDPLLFSAPISAGVNDADENQSGTVRRSNGDLNLGSGGGGSPTTLALRFTGVQVPNGATITNAEVQFTVDETGSNTTNLVVQAERAVASHALR